MMFIIHSKMYLHNVFSKYNFMHIILILVWTIGWLFFLNTHIHLIAQNMQKIAYLV